MDEHTRTTSNGGGTRGLRLEMDGGGESAWKSRGVLGVRQCQQNWNAGKKGRRIRPPAPTTNERLAKSEGLRAQNEGGGVAGQRRWAELDGGGEVVWGALRRGESER